MGENWRDKVKSIGSIWSEAKDIRAFFKNGEPSLIKETDAGMSEMDRDSVARKELSANDIIHFYVLEVKARDTHNPRRIVKTTLTGYALKKVLMQTPYPTRKAVNMGHDKYSVIMAFLMKRGVVARKDNGYRWLGEFERMENRASWLIETLKREGQMRVRNREGRYQILD